MTDEIPMHTMSDNDEAIINEGKLFAVVGYLGILCLVPLILKKDNGFAMFHGKQGLVLLIAEVACAIISAIPFFGPIIGVLGYVAFGLLSLAGILQVLMGNFWRMPMVADIADNISL